LKIKTGIRVLFYSGALAFVIHRYWGQICFAKGRMDARFNLFTHRRIVCTFGPRSPEGYNRSFSRYWNGEPWDDTTWIADSLVFSKFGFTARACEEDKNLGFFAQEAGGYCTSASTYYTSGYASLYNAYVEKAILPLANAEAKSILASRPPNWKDGLSAQDWKIRLLFFK
jgi:hypothetical protein